jgi:hypothetical protein
MQIDADPEFHLMRIWVPKIMRIHVDPDPQNGVTLSLFRILSYIID